MGLFRLLLIILAVIVLRRLLGWVFAQWGRLAANKQATRQREGNRRAQDREVEALSDQRIDEADYEELG